MANDLFGGLMKGLSGMMPKDDPDTKIFTAGSDLQDLKDQEKDLYAQIGKKAFSSVCNNPDFEDLVLDLKQVQRKLRQAEDNLRAIKEEKDQIDRQKKEELDARTCKDCGAENPEGTKFCQECGSKLGAAAKNICQGCGAQNPAGTKFCGDCGSKL